MPENTPELSMIVPCYNEQGAIRFSLPALVNAFADAGIGFEIIAVDNGSTDRTGEILEELVAEGLPLTPVRIDDNVGYGNGVLQGIPAARGAWIGWIPADGQVEATDVVKLFEVLRHSDVPLLGKARRRFRLDGIKRKVISIVYNAFVVALFPGIGSIDVNGTPKIMPAEALRRMKLESTAWFLDPELMLKARHLGLRVLEMNVFAQMRSAGVSHVRLTTCWEFLVKLLQARFTGSLRPWKREVAGLPAIEAPPAPAASNRG